LGPINHSNFWSISPLEFISIGILELNLFKNFLSVLSESIFDELNSI
jgi:hypothetical protein